MAGLTAGGLLARILAGAGVQAAYGVPAPHLGAFDVGDPELATTLASAHRAVHHVGAVVVADDRTVELAGVVSDPPATIDISSVAELAGVGPVVEAAVSAGTGLRIHLDLDPNTPYGGPTPQPPAADSWAQPDDPTIEALRSASSVAVLAGPGVVASGAVPGLHALATAGGLGVLNTWGAKGVFHWRSRHHFATAGLQEGDFALGGLADVDLVVVVGNDDREAPRRLWQGYPHIVVDPVELSALAQALAGRPLAGDPPMPPLRDRLAAATQSRWTSDTVPLAPSRVTLHYSRRLAGGGLCAADAGGPSLSGGGAGFWVARTFGTTALGGASVPAAVVPGWAVASVLVARLANPLRPALAVVDGVVDEDSLRLLELARSLGVNVGIEVWAADGDRLDPGEHLERVAALADPAGGGVATLATDTSQIDDFVTAAGPVRAWAD